MTWTLQRLHVATLWCTIATVASCAILLVDFVANSNGWGFIFIPIFLIVVAIPCATISGLATRDRWSYLGGVASVPLVLYAFDGTRSSSLDVVLLQGIGTLSVVAAALFGIAAFLKLPRPTRPA